MNLTIYFMGVVKRLQMTRLYCIGELLIDFISKTQGVTLLQADSFEKKAGGAPANVAVAASRLDVETYFLGQVGSDAFGQYLSETLQAQDVRLDYLKRDGKTTLAFVSLDQDGERSFEFFRGSDGSYILPEEIEIQLNDQDIIHFGSATAFLPGELKTSYYRLLECALQKQSFISFDPNYRDLLVSDLQLFKKDCFYFMERAHLIKLSEEEAMLLTETNTLSDAIQQLRKTVHGMITITLGKAGTRIIFGEEDIIIPSISIDAVDTTGAGDCFIGTLLSQIATVDVHHIEKVQFEEFVLYANTAAALTCTKYGAIPALPSRAEIEEKRGTVNDVG